MAPLFPPIIAGFLSGYDVLSNVYVPVHSVSCFVKDGTPTYHIFYAMMVLPSLAFVYAFVFISYKNTLCWQPFGLVAQLHPDRKERLQQRLLTRGRRCVSGLEAGPSPLQPPSTAPPSRPPVPPCGLSVSPPPPPASWINCCAPLMCSAHPPPPPYRRLTFADFADTLGSMGGRNKKGLN